MPDVIPHSMLMIDNVRERAEEFDVLHFHIDLFHFPYQRWRQALIPRRWERTKRLCAFLRLAEKCLILSEAAI
jgi:hypothetical protein